MIRPDDSAVFITLQGDERTRTAVSLVTRFAACNVWTGA